MVLGELLELQLQYFEHKVEVKIYASQSNETKRNTHTLEYICVYICVSVYILIYK